MTARAPQAQYFIACCDPHRWHTSSKFAPHQGGASFFQPDQPRSGPEIRQINVLDQYWHRVLAGEALPKEDKGSA